MPSVTSLSGNIYQSKGFQPEIHEFQECTSGFCELPEFVYKIICVEMYVHFPWEQIYSFHQIQEGSVTPT